MKKFEIRYTNLNKECLLDGTIKKTIFADDEVEAKWLCEDLYSNRSGHFKIKSLKQIGQI